MNYKENNYNESNLNMFIDFIKPYDTCEIKRDDWRNIIWAIQKKNTSLCANFIDRHQGLVDTIVKD